MSDKINPLEDKNLIRVERHPRKSGGPRTVLIMHCSECPTEIKVRKSEYHKSSKKCSSHSHRKKPFESIFNSFKFNDHRKIENTFTFEEFLDFTKIEECHYCLSPIEWNEYSISNNEYISRAYNLDRMDNSKGYSVENSVVCCTRCNRARSDKFTYEEWYGMTEYFRSKK